MDLPEYAVIGSATADILTTELALANDGFRELNPILQDSGTRVAAKALATTAVILGSRKLKKSGHKGWAKALCWTVSGVWLGAALWNRHQLAHGKR